MTICKSFEQRRPLPLVELAVRYKAGKLDTVVAEEDLHDRAASFGHQVDLLEVHWVQMFLEVVEELVKVQTVALLSGIAVVVVRNKLAGFVPD